MALLTDETWAQLDARAGRLSRRERLQVVLALAAVVLVGTGAILVDRSEVVWPRVDVDYSMASTADSATGRISEQVTVLNHGWRTVHLDRIGADAAGLHFDGSPDVPTTIAPGGSVNVTLNYTVTDCTAVARTQRLTVPVSVGMWWGQAASTVSPPDMPATQDGPGGPIMQPWQWFLASQACTGQ